jgi:predicted metal-dependent TIM-barrel fold hydrolase
MSPVRTTVTPDPVDEPPVISSVSSSRDAVAAQLRVYVSSTYTDLRAYRAAVVSILARFGLDTVSLDEFGALDQPPLAASLRAIDESDILVVLIAHRLGYVPPETKKSIVELEYDRAVERGKPVLPFLLHDSFPWPPDQIDSDSKGIRRFRKRIEQECLVSFFTTPEDLTAKVAAAISQYSRQVEGIPVSPPSPRREAEEITLADVVAELKAMRTEVSLVQQAVGENARRAMNPGATSADVLKLNPADFLGAAAPFLDPQRCFVIMPYSEKWSGAVERIILEVCTQVGLDFQIAKNMEGRFIPNDIWRGITGAGVIVADLSAANPNVAYEVGLADVTGKEVILIGQQAKVPFDFSAQRLILYEDSLSGTLTLREELTSRLKRYKGRCESEDN